MRMIAALLLTAGTAFAEGERAGEFDYWVLSLSWSPSWCALEGDSRSSPQCEDGRGFGWVLHGLWPQYEEGWPSWCATSQPPPNRSGTGSMADIMGSSGAAWHQWRKHGVCSGLSSDDFFALSREAYDRIARPEVFRQIDRTLEVPARVVEDAFLEANFGLQPDMITITCKAGRIQEARICLDRSLEFRVCGADVARDCGLEDARLDPLR